MDQIDTVRFNVLRNAIYHASRWRFLDTSNRVISALIVLSGAAAVGDVFVSIGLDSKWLVVAATLFGTVQLVFDLSSKARTHEFLQKRFFELAAEIEEAGEMGTSMLPKWEAALRRLYAEEPPPMRALNEVAYNSAMISMGRPPEHLVRITWWQNLLKQFWAFNGTTFQTFAEQKSPTR